MVALPDVTSHGLRPFEAAVLETARRRRLLRPEHRVLVALSGGPDSTALVAALAALRDAREIAELHACHVDHQLRPGSASDGDHCQQVCAALGVPLRRASVDVARSGNLQSEARRARYEALSRAADEAGADRLATGHTRSDQAETVLHRLLRGSGARGLSGIPSRRGRIVRPLIELSRDDVLAYLRDRGLSWRDDPTNASGRFLRNRIRHEVLPLLGELAPGLERRLARTADLLRDDDRALDAVARHLVEDGGSQVAVAALAAQPAAVRRRVVRLLWRSAAGTRRGLGAAHVEAALRLARARGPRRLALPGGLELRVAYGLLEVAPPAPAPAAFAPVEVAGPGRYRIPERGLTVELTWRAPGPAPWPVELRGRRPGDRFRATAAGGKKLKAWLIDRKVPRSSRQALVIVADRSGRVLAVPELGVVSKEATGLVVVLHPDAPSRA